MPQPQHNVAPQPERSIEQLRYSVWEEVLENDKTIATFPQHNPVLPVSSWQRGNSKEAALATGFVRGRKVMQAIAYGHDYWEIEYGMGITLGEVPANQHEGITLVTRRLFQLAVLSRASVAPYDSDSHWALPTFGDIVEAKSAVREELGVTGAFEASVRDPNMPLYIPDFPGIDGAALANAIVTGQLTIGNPEQPEVECWVP